MTDMEEVELQAAREEAVDALVALGVRLTDAVLESVTLRDPKVAALAEQFVQQERLVQRLRRAHITLVAG